MRTPPLRLRFVLALAAAGCFVAAVTTALRAQAPAAEPRIFQGIYTEAQAARGKETFSTNCLRCHGVDLNGTTAPALKGDRFYTSWGGEPVDRLFLKIRDTMPPSFGTALLDDKTKLDIVAYILKSNDYPAGASELTVGNADLATALILKKGQQITVQNFTLVQAVGCLARDGDAWKLTRTAEPISTREDSSSPQSLQSAAARPLGSRTFLLLSVVPFSPATHVGQKMEARGLVYNDPEDSRITLTSLRPTGEVCN
jgi:S-disulfanyl-L-cysteine oxidoreductase SoxD